VAVTYALAESKVRINECPRKDGSDLSGKDLLNDERSLFVELCATHWFAADFQRVKKNKGSPGVDEAKCMGHSANLYVMACGDWAASYLSVS
jgi:hypothetical protein